MPEITKVQITIRKFLFETREAVRDPQKAIEWLRSFRETLEFQDLVDRPNAYAMAVIDDARNFNDVQRKNSQMKQVKRALEQDGVKNPTRAQMEYKWRAMYLSADAPTREDGEFKSDSGDAGDLESATSANNSEARESQRRAGTDSVRGTPLHRAPARPRAPFRNKEDFMAWAIDAGLDPVDAGECWEATEERGGKDADGNTVKNMKAFARQWCRTRSKRRSA